MENLFEHLDFRSLSIAILTFFLGFIAAKVSATLIKKALTSKLPEHQINLVSRLAFYILLVIFLISSLQKVGFQFGVLLGAAGIVTLAIGFASQLSVSNIISGLFLYFEKPFKVGQTISVNNITGQVYAINFLSINIRTPENALIRVPNETLIKNNIVNYSYFPIRNISFSFVVPHTVVIDTMVVNLKNIAKKLSEVGFEKEPTVLVSNLNKEGAELTLTIWIKQDDIPQTKNKLYQAVEQYLKEHKIYLAPEYLKVKLVEAK